MVIRISVVLALAAVVVLLVSMGTIAVLERVAEASSYEISAGRCVIRWFILMLTLLAFVLLVFLAVAFETGRLP